MMIKIDLEKAFDHHEWSFIRYCLQRLNFSSQIIQLIMSCVTTSFITILVNGKPTPFFQPTRGLRQRDPLSPYLFIICMETLSNLIDEVVIAKQWTPIKFSRQGPPLFHLLLAGDLVLFAKSDIPNAHSILNIFN